MFNLDLSDRLWQRLQAYYIACGGTQYILDILANDGTPDCDSLNENWSDNKGLFYGHPIAGGTITVCSPSTGDQEGSSATLYGLADEERRLNLNTVPGAVFRNLLGITGRVRESDAKAIADAIEDWRDEDSEKRENGAENFYYLTLGNSYECKDGPFEMVEELLLVKGVTPPIFARIADYLTVYGSGKVNINTAGFPVLRALGLSEEGAYRVLAYRVGEDGVEGTRDDRVLRSCGAILSELRAWVPAEDLNRLSRLINADLVTVKSEDFRFSILARAEGAKESSRLSCVMDRLGQIKEWTEE